MISDEFREKLETYEPEQEVELIILAKPAEDLENTLKKILGRNPPEERETTKNYNQQSIANITAYLEGIKAVHKTQPTLGSVHTTVRKKEIEPLSKSLGAYIQAILENQEITIKYHQ